MDDETLAQIEQDWSRVCGCCDAGLTMNCVCPKEDPRSVIGKLLEHIKELKDQRDDGRD
jgi:hypothetical protein